MSGYGYDYSLTPARSGWRSVLTGFLTIVAVVAVSTISGAVVTLELIAPSPQRAAGNRANDTQVTASVPQHTVSQQAIQSQAPQAAPTVAAPKVASHVVAPRTVPSADVAAPVQSQQAQAPVQPVAPASTTVAANAAPASAAPAAPPVAPAPAMAYAQATVADSELTFSKGYARRRATVAAAKAGNARLADVGVAAGQIGRTNVKVVKIYKPRIQAVAAQDPRQDPRRPDVAWSANRFDFDRHQALAFGDAARQQQRRAPSGGSFFDRLF